MKLHNLSVIFVVIAIPLILITSYYISLQIDTINMQTAYDAKLLDSTKEAIDAFEINTVQWNSAYSDTADSKRRDVMASINTFINSFANNAGVGGTSKEYIMAYMPAIAYTLYDGYYIYSPANEQLALKDDNGVGIVMTEKLWDSNGDDFSGYIYDETDEGKLLYQVANGGVANDGTYMGIPFTLNQENAATEYKHILKPFAMYTEKINDWVINYTLDNYITIYGNITNPDGTTEYVYKSGYLTDLNKIDGISSNSVTDITFKKDTEDDLTKVEPEYLSEQIVYKDSKNGPITRMIANYVYECEGNTKVYFDALGSPFTVDSNLIRTYLTEDVPKYKKITVPQFKSGGWSYIEVYQNLFNGRWYRRTPSGKFEEKETGVSYISGLSDDRLLDYSAINYCVESYIITSFVNNVPNLKPQAGTDGNCVCGYSHENDPLHIDSDNDPENPDSDFCIHKRGIIKNTVELNLNQAITSYSRNNATGEYKLPKLTETDWDQVLTNVSIITFIQNIPIGMKYYNNYAIATSTVNKEYVDPDEIYLNASNGDSEYYHTRYCSKLGENDLIGYRSIDYVQKSYTEKNASGNDETKYYYRHSNGDAIDANQACYYCLVQRSLYEENKTDKKEKAYNTALARERYVAKMSKLPAEAEAEFKVVGTSDPEGTGNIYISEVDNSGNVISSEVVSGMGIASKKIAKSDVGKKFKVYGDSNNIFSGSSEVEINASDTDLGNPAAVTETELGTRASYTTDDSIAVSILQYDSKGLTFNFDTHNKKGNPEYGSGAITDIFGNGDKTYIDSELGTGYINVKLHYKTNYTVGADKRVEVWANINDYDNLTIAVKPIDITGRVRLKFTNKADTYYSVNTFIVKAGDVIYCKIPENTTWYEDDWSVEILNVNNENQVTGKTEYYTINDATGLKGFSDAVNGTKGPEGGAKTVGRTFKVINNITSVGELAPIAGVNKPGNDGWNKIWFEGTFQGNDHTINGITMSYTNDETYNSFGLFGWVGKNARISGLKVGINVASFNSSEPKNKERDNRICIGGIAGYTDGQINNCTIMSSSNIGAGSISVNSGINKKDIYYVGGIAGYTKGAITQCKVESNVKVKGGKIDHSNSTKLDKFLETYAGGLIGYKETNQEINDSFSANCTVEGYDNVGGIIGFNAGGDINNVSFKGSLTGSGENIGGIVGCNTRGNIYNCINTVNINVKGENVGGIVGCNYNANVVKCYNNAKVTGNKNVGGVIGVCYGGTIDYCGNNNEVTGKENENYFNLFYNTAANECTGTGGITGKLYRAKALHSYNSGNINCNYNGGGISGLNHGSTVEYSYNSGTISSSSRNRIGGICGAGNTVYINACYNIGTINGNGDIDVLSNGMGGIIGSCVDNAYFLFIGKEEVLPENKYFDAIEVPVVKMGQSVNEVMYCYNTGNLNGSTGSDTLNHASGIIGCIMWALNKDDITLLNNYYLDNVGKGAKGSWSNIVSNGVTRLSSQDMKKQLYKWADSSLKIESNYVYNTITPLETDKGYEGYGVLWWQLENYARLTSNMFLCNKSKEDGIVTYDYTNFKNAGYGQTITLINSESKEAKIEFRKIATGICRINESFNGKPVKNETGCYRWIMMIPKGNYGVKGTTDFSKKSQFFDYDSQIYEGEQYNMNISNDTTLYIAPVLEVITDRFDTKSIDVQWKREYTHIKRYGVYNKPDFIPRTINVNAYYDRKPCSSKYNVNGKTVSVELDKIKTEGLNNTTAYLDDYTYYRMGFFKMHGPYIKKGDTEDVRTKWAECYVYIPVENLVDRLGSESAQNFILHTAKVNMKYRIRMWCEKGDFGSWWTNPAKLKNSTLEYKVTVQRKKQGTSEWIEVKTINIPKEYKKQTSESGNIGDDGYYTFEYEINKEDFSGSLANVNYDDELRVCVWLKFTSKEGNCTFFIDKTDLDITYGPNVIE